MFNFQKKQSEENDNFFTTLHCVVFLVTATTIHTCSVAWCNYAHNSIHPFPVNGGITNILSDTDISDNVLKVNWPYFADVAINGTHTYTHSDRWISLIARAINIDHRPVRFQTVPSTYQTIESFREITC